MFRRWILVFVIIGVGFFPTCTHRVNEANEKHKDVINPKVYRSWYNERMRDSDMTEQGYVDVSISNRGGVYAWGWGYLGSSLIDMYEVTGDTAYLDLFVPQADYILARRNSELGRESFSGSKLILPAWSDKGNYSESGDFVYTYPVHTAMIVIPMLQFVKAVRENGLAEYHDKALYYLEAAGNALSFHDQTWVDFSSEEGYYFGHDYGAGEVAESGLEGIPNRVHIYLAACGLYDYLAGTSLYTRKIRNAFRYFKNNLLFHDPEFDAYYWSYWNQSGMTNWEDISHAFLTVYAITILQYDAGFKLFSDEEMQRFANMVYKIIDEGDPPLVRKYIHPRPGETDPYYAPENNHFYAHAFRWSLLSRVDPGVLDRTLALYPAVYGEGEEMPAETNNTRLKDLSINISSLQYLSSRQETGQ